MKKSLPNHSSSRHQAVLPTTCFRPSPWHFVCALLTTRIAKSWSLPASPPSCSPWAHSCTQRSIQSLDAAVPLLSRSSHTQPIPHQPWHSRGALKSNSDGVTKCEVHGPDSVLDRLPFANVLGDVCVASSSMNKFGRYKIKHRSISEPVGGFSNYGGSLTSHTYVIVSVYRSVNLEPHPRTTTGSVLFCLVQKKKHQTEHF